MNLGVIEHNEKLSFVHSHTCVGRAERETPLVIDEILPFRYKSRSSLQGFLSSFGMTNRQIFVIGFFYW